MITNADATLYNTVTLKGETTVYRTEIYGVNWQDKTQSTVGETGLKTAKSTKIFIPLTATDQVEGKKYLEPVAFKKEEAKDDHFTFEPDCLIVKGICPYDLQNGTEKELRAQYDNVVKVFGVDTNDNGSYGMQHFELEAK